MRGLARARRAAFAPRLEKAYDLAISALWDECDASQAVKALLTTRMLRVGYAPDGQAVVERVPVNKRGWFPAPDLLASWADVDMKGFKEAALLAGVALVW